MAMMGIPGVACSAGSCRTASIPSIPGRRMSIRIRLGCRSWARRTPSSPVSASMISYPLNVNTSRTSLRFLSLSSTTRISSFATAYRDREREGRPAAHFTLHPNSAPVQLDEPAAKGHPESRPLLSRRAGSDLTELLEHRVLVLRRDADPGIADRHFDRPVHRRCPHLDPAALWRELDRVRQQVQDDLPNLPLVSPNLAEPLIDGRLQPDSPSPGPLADERQGVVDRLREIEVGDFQLHPPGLDLREIKDVVDEGK